MTGCIEYGNNRPQISSVYRKGDCCKSFLRRDAARTLYMTLFSNEMTRYLCTSVIALRGTYPHKTRSRLGRSKPYLAENNKRIACHRRDDRWPIPPHIPEYMPSISKVQHVSRTAYICSQSDTTESAEGYKRRRKRRQANTAEAHNV